MLKVSVFHLLLCNARYFSKVQPAPFFLKFFFLFFTAVGSGGSFGFGQRWYIVQRRVKVTASITKWNIG